MGGRVTVKMIIQNDLLECDLDGNDSELHPMALAVFCYQTANDK